MLPGGGMGRKESAEVAATRELMEEVGCRMDNAECFWVDIVDIYGAKNHVHLVIGRSDDLPVADRREIIAAEFYPLDALPEMTELSTRARIECWRNRNTFGSASHAIPAPG